MGLALISGGSRGLGASLCEEYLQRGWTVVEFSRSAPFAFSVRVDLSNPERAADVFGDTLAPLAACGISELVAINNAAVLSPVGPVASCGIPEVVDHIGTNITAGILFARAIVHAFQSDSCPKTFVNISSGAAVKPYAGWSLYCASKAAMESFVRSLALEQSTQPHPISAINVNPGVMDTTMQATVRASSIEDFPALERFVALQKDGKLTPPAAVAARIASLVDSRPDPGGTYSAGVRLEHAHSAGE